MTNTTTAHLSTTAAVLPTTDEAIDYYLRLHGYENTDDARADMVAFGCFGCGSIASVTATTEDERQTQRDLIDWSCCEDADDFRI